MSVRSEMSKDLVGFVDIVFGVIIGVSLVGFFDDVREGVPLGSFGTCVLVVSYLSVVLSWVGYHQSIRERPHTPVVGYIRFGVDLVILLGYLVLVYFFDRFGLILGTYAALFFLYLLWGVLKMWEHALWPEQRTRYAWRLPSFAVTTGFAVAWHLGTRWYWPYPPWEVPPLAVVFACVVWYRYAPQAVSRVGGWRDRRRHRA